MSTLRLLALACGLAAALAAPARGAPTTGAVVGTVHAASGAPVEGAAVAASGPSGRYAVRSDARGRFTLAAIAADTYDLTISAPGFAAERIPGVVVAPGATVNVNVTLATQLAQIGRTRAASGTFAIGETRDAFTISGAQARGPIAASASGLATYAAGTVQSAVAALPAVQHDPFANVLIRGGKVDDVVFSYDAVPLPQAIVAEPGGNVIGAQLPTTGLGYATVTTGGFAGGSDDALGGLVDEIPLAGVYPAQSTLTLGIGALAGGRDAEYERRWATPSLRQRYAVDARIGDAAFRYGDGTTFYPAEAATYGLALANRASWSVAANAHVRSGARDDVEVVALAGEATYDQYGTPFSGETAGTFAGAVTPFPGADPTAQVTTPTRIRGTYAIEKVQLLRTFDHSYARVRAYRSSYGAATNAPFFDDLSFPNGVISYAGAQSAVLTGAGFDALSLGSEHHRIESGLELRRQTSTLDQLVPTLDERLTANPVLTSALAFLADAWSPSRAFTLQGALRATQTHVVRSNATPYTVAAVDPHAAAVFRRGADAFRVTYDRTTVAPKPLQAERNDSAAANAPFAPLAPERGDSYAASFEHASDRARVWLTFFAKSERDRIDLLPANYRAAGAPGTGSGAALGVPQNAGALLANGAELSVASGRLSLAAGTVHARSSSASQFALNDLNAAAVAANHLFPAGYVPALTATASYRVDAGRWRIVPAVSFESGYPYGNGRRAWTFAPDGTPVSVLNDNHVNPGYNYYFLADPSAPYDARTNPVVATLGTPEGDDPNTLRSSPLVLVSLHVERALSPRVVVSVDVANAFGTATPTQLQSNPYLIGPPGYAGGNAAYAAWYGAQLAGTPYTLGNGVPTNDGVRAILPWTYGTSGYVPSSYPEARSIALRLRVTL